MRRTLFFLGLCAGLFFLRAHPASAATLSILLDRNNAAIGDTFTATLRISSPEESINAAQATVSFPKDLVEAVDIDTDGSIFDFWLEKPPASDQTGSFTFIGGSSNGYKGASLFVWKATFRVKGSGPIALQLMDAAVSASDGSGTNILTEVRGAFIASDPKAGLWAPLPEPLATSTSPLGPILIPLPPVQITREPIPASGLPILPRVEIPLYPKPETWYNARENFLVTWELPPDVSDVATAFTQNPGTIPSRSEGLFDNKIFPAPENGISYIHVRFKNALGWGKTLHYRIAVDTVPPAPFKALIEEGPATDNPTPTIVYRTTDPISRIERYLIHVDQQDPVSTLEERYTLPIQLPGTHTVRIEAFDQSGNATEVSLEVDVTPLPSPVLARIDNELFIGEGELEVSGGATPSSTLILSVKNAAGQLMEAKKLVADTEGNWRTVFEFPLVKGTYVIEVFTRDERGATSYVVRSNPFRVRTRPFLVLAGVEITETVFFSTVIFLLLVGFAFGWVTRSLQKQRRVWRTIITQRGVANALDAVLKETGTILKKFKKDSLGEQEAFDTKRLLQRMQKRVKAIQTYLLNEINDLNK
jgi:hypothetical protein